MSNVLIGIIGVILFIGLALAGALFLGPQFTTATYDTQAARVVSSIQQVTSALNMYRAVEGIDHQSALNGDLAPTYLKSYPIALDGGTGSFGSTNDDGTQTAAPYTYVITGVYNADQSRAVPICRSIALKSGQSVPATGAPIISSLSQLTTQTGCFVLSTQQGVLVANRAYAYGKI